MFFLYTGPGTLVGASKIFKGKPAFLKLYGGNPFRSLSRFLNFVVFLAGAPLHGSERSIRFVVA